MNYCLACGNNNFNAEAKMAQGYGGKFKRDRTQTKHDSVFLGLFRILRLFPFIR